MASRAQGLCARLALSLLLLAGAANAQPEACAAAEAEAAGRSPPPAAAAGWQHALVGEPPAGPRIIDISVALDAATPKFSSPDGLGREFRVLETSQAKGDAYTSSLLRLGAHTGAARCGWALRSCLLDGSSRRALMACMASECGYHYIQPGKCSTNANAGTHVDSPGHFIAEAYAAGAGVDRLDLHALNGA